jgi:histidine ammonia-lyase
MSAGTVERPAFVLRPGALRGPDLRRVLAGEANVVVDPAARAGVERAAEVVRAIAARDESVYGVNTGFGKLAHTRIPRERLADLQRNLVLSHACGVGAPLDAATTRLAIVLKVGSLARGYSGVRWEVVETLLALLERDVVPVIPSQGSVGASGDLAPLAHLSAVLLGVGEAWHRGERMPAADALARAGIAPLALEAKEGLALLNGTQISTALALRAVIEFENLLAAALVAGALTIDAALGSTRPFDPRIHAIRGHAAQSAVATTMRALLAGSTINDSHANCGRVQDPYSLRCIPQVLGACLRTLQDTAAILIDEANAVSDNPLVFADTAEVISGGNFHAEPVAFAADALAVAIAEVGNLSERRTALLVDPTFSQLPAFLAADPGLESGYMIAQVTAAALASENKGLAHPASVDTIPTSAGQEDHVSMATHAARRLGPMLENAAAIVAIELLAAARGIAFRRPLRSSAPLEAALDQLARAVHDADPNAPDPSHDRGGDRALAPAIATLTALVRSGAFVAAVAELLPTVASA